MILRHIVDMPRLYSGEDKAGLPWTAMFLPEAFGTSLSAMTSRQRINVLRGLYADFRKST